MMTTSLVAGGVGNDGVVGVNDVDRRGTLSEFAIHSESGNDVIGNSRQSSSSHRGDEMAGMVDPDETDSPWVGCCHVINNDCCGGDWSFHNVGGCDDEEGEMEEVVDIDEDDVTNNGAVAILVNCGCPTVDGLAEAELDAYTKTLTPIANAKKKAKERKKTKAKGFSTNSHELLHNLSTGIIF